MTQVAPPTLLPGASSSTEQLTRIEYLYMDAERQLNARLDDILQRGPEWYREEARLRNLLRAAQQSMNDIRAALDEETLQFGLGQIYAEGASEEASVIGQAFEWAQPHVGAVDRIARDTFDDLLRATTYVEDSAKALIRQAAKLNTSRKLTTGKTAVQAGQALATDLRASGIGVVTYRNGARHGVGEYARMVLRTKTATAYNIGTVNHSVSAGVHFFEILDGSDCGLSYHNDPTLANGLVVPRDVAAAYVIAHPNCRRTFGARPDVNAQPKGITFDPSTTAAQREDQAAFEKYLRDQQRGKRTPRAKRKPTPAAPRQPRRPRDETPPSTPAPRPEPKPERPPSVPREPKAAPKAEPRPSAAAKARAVTKGPAPGTGRLADTFVYADAKAETFRPVADAIDKLHGRVPSGDAKLNESLTVRWERQTGSTGGGFTARGKLSGKSKPRRVRGQPSSEYYQRVQAWRDEPIGPRIQAMSKSSKLPNSPQAQFAFAHEVGHSIDMVDVVPGRMIFATGFPSRFEDPVIREALEDFLVGVRETTAYKEVAAYGRRAGPEAYRYLTSAEELWARAYSQWVAREVATPDLLEGLAYWRDGGASGYQWTDAEFDAAVGPRVEAVLRARGMMT